MITGVTLKMQSKILKHVSLRYLFFGPQTDHTLIKYRCLTKKNNQITCASLIMCVADLSYCVPHVLAFWSSAQWLCDWAYSHIIGYWISFIISFGFRFRLTGWDPKLLYNRSPPDNQVIESTSVWVNSASIYELKGINNLMSQNKVESYTLNAQQCGQIYIYIHIHI